MAGTNNTHRTKARIQLLTLLLFLVSLAVAFFIGEIIIRFTYPEIDRVQHRDTNLGWASKEYKQFDPALDMEDERTRLLFLGDSFLAGSGIRSMASRFPTVLGNKLGDQLVTRILATGGWGTDQELLAFREKGAAWKPNIVILAFCANNDISNNLSNDDNMHKPKPYFVSDSHGLQLLDSEGNKLDYDSYGQQSETSRWSLRSHLIDFTRHMLFGRHIDEGVSGTELNEQYPNVDKRYLLFSKRNFKRSDIQNRKTRLTWSPQEDVTPYSAYIHEDFKLNTYQWQLTESIINRLKEEVETAGGRLFVMLLPVIINPRDDSTITGGTFEQLYETPAGPVTLRSAEPRERLTALTKRLDIPFLDPTQEFISYVKENDLLIATWPAENNRHFSEVGHEFLAKWLVNHIETLTATPIQ